MTHEHGRWQKAIYGCAADRNQASIVFNVAADMVRMCPSLAKRVKILDSMKRLIYQPTGSIYQVLSADVGNKHGFNTHGVVFDELHTQPKQKQLQARINELEELKQERNRKAAMLGHYIRNLEERKTALTAFDDRVWAAVVQKVTVLQDGGLLFRFKDGTEKKA